MKELDYVRGKLLKAQQDKQWRSIEMATLLTRTTFYNILKPDYKPNVATIETLASHFRSIRSPRK